MAEGLGVAAIQVRCKAKVFEKTLTVSRQDA
jgi:hypothetical protein